MLNWAIVPVHNTGGTNGSTLLERAAFGSRFIPKLASQNWRSARKKTGTKSAGSTNSAAHLLCTNTAPRINRASATMPKIEIERSKLSRLGQWTHPDVVVQAVDLRNVPRHLVDVSGDVQPSRVLGRNELQSPPGTHNRHDE